MDFPVFVPGYAVEGMLGSGGDGSEWVAREEAGGRRVALKLLHLPDPAARERARRELALMTAVEHPHVLQVYAIVDAPGALVIVRDIADGGSLADLLAARGALSPGEIVTVCAPAAQALAELHLLGLVHGDVSPDTLVFSSDGRPMLSDAGLSRIAGDRFADLGLTPGYSAPEVVAGHPAQPGSDVYALAAVALRALTGYVPTHALLLPGIPPATQAALAQAMNPDPSRRPSAASLANALFVLADPIPVGIEEVADVVEAEPVAAPRHRSRHAAREPQPQFDTPAAAHQDSPPPSPVQATPEPPPPPAAAPATETVDLSQAVESPDTLDAPRRRRRPAVEPERPPHRLPEAESERPPRRRRRIEIARILAVVIAIPVIVAGAVFAVLQLTNGSDPEALPGAGRLSSPGEAEVPVDLCGGPQPAPTEEPPAVSDWTQVVQSLYALRTEAFAEVDASALCDVYTPTSQVLAEDAELLQLYADAGVHTDGLAFEVVTAEMVSQEGGRVVLEITDRLPPYQLVDDSGEVVAEKEGLPEATWQAELVPAPDASGWRFG
ncbi:MAG TPA: protein kinase [Jiangellaceae bacterium]|nr:protein kinase [Jiangellaceae bacterium]